jgi:putative ABC transport system substrate-binding protein
MRQTCRSVRDILPDIAAGMIHLGVGQMAIGIGRRQFISALGGATVAWPLAARAQLALPEVGFLSSRSPDESAAAIAAFRQGLKEAGFIEGQNVVIAFRWAEGAYDKLPELAADLVHRQVSVIAAISPQATLAAKTATTKIPIVFQSGADPVTAGLVASLNRPGGNLTGFYRSASEFVPKCMELLREVSPKATVVAVLLNPTSVLRDPQSRDAQAAARDLGMQLHVVNASTESDFEPAFKSLTELKVGALVIGTDSFFTSRSEQLASMTARYLVPAIATSREFAAAGGLMSYDASLADQYRQVGGYIGRILKGEKPAELPVQQATKYELVINLKTAKALGLTMPDKLLVIADEVIE